MGSIVTRKAPDGTVSYRAFVRRTVNGKQVGKSKVFRTKKEADQWMRDNESTAALAAIGTSTGPTFGALLDAFVVAPPTKGTRYWAASHIDFWRAELGAMKTREIDRGTINTCKAKLMAQQARHHTPDGTKETGKKLTPATVNRYLASLSSVMNFAVQRTIIDHHPMKAGQVRKEQESNGRRRILTQDEERRLYAACETSSWPMMRLFLRVCLTTGARKSEVLRLRWQDVDIARSVAWLHNTKNGDSRAMPLVSDVKASLADASKVRPLKSDYVFYDPRHPDRPKEIAEVWKAVRKRAGLWQDRDDPLDQVVLHTTRHTTATKLVRSEKNLAKVQAVTGHKTLAMLSRYTHLDTDDAVDLAERALG
ncbi:tyrosine-type recombinase/integrase [Ralstonia pseudosolanacearum]|uniref:tyrosine-type recombinase/integrase n=1 Tax=Ralstonia pseudosolanacearum TaxID=1310165 RepID=UPI00048A9D8C|nr:site-specific integrase [Ralstonia pseudosolanacearum]MDO3558294.1 site-specific integrase [Ralstonia pseudosolanacearum]MDO3575513.1 site-specific integrase [Ralstonia pseudosolanacearum]MDO3586885.1 site-specific integrase [Ralstonia pseudosolanacearum]